MCLWLGILFLQGNKMKKILLLILIVILSGCVKVGEFSPDSRRLYEYGKVDCEKTPEKCHKGIPW